MVSPRVIAFIFGCKGMDSGLARTTRREVQCDLDAVPARGHHREQPRLSTMLRFFCIAIVLMLPFTRGDAAPFTWHGQIRCVVIPGANTLPLVGDFEMVMDGSRLTYERPVHNADKTSLSGVEERGVGELNGNAITLRGGASSQGYSYTAIYQGQIEGGHAVLTGEQVWTLAKASVPFHRGCRITSSR
jgi:hypothetical protein